MRKIQSCVRKNVPRTVCRRERPRHRDSSLPFPALRVERRRFEGEASKPPPSASRPPQCFSAHSLFVRYDERGCGMSDWLAGPLSLDQWFADLRIGPRSRSTPSTGDAASASHRVPSHAFGIRSVIRSASAGINSVRRLRVDGDGAIRRRRSAHIGSSRLVPMLDRTCENCLTFVERRLQGPC